MSQVDGIYANHALLTIINDLVGKEVLVEAIDGAKYSGIFTACSPEFDIGLRHAYKITTGNMTNLLPKKEDMTTKMLFKFSDIVAMSALMNEEKIIRGFATDRDYHIKQQNGRLGDEEHELQEWSADEDGEEFESLDQMPDQRQRYQRNNGWNVEDMFNTNSQMGVQSTYEEDLRQYTTAPVEGNEEDRRRADQIAREIESSQQSKFNARLENDDDERDLDKQTTEDDFEIQTKRAGFTGQRGNFNSRNQRNGINGPPVGSRRGDAVKGGPDRRSSGTPARYPTQAHSVNSSQGRVVSGNKYEPKSRPTAQELTDSFNEFSLNKEGNPRRDSSQGQKTYENKGQSQSTKILLEPRSSASSRSTTADPKSQSGAAARRADGLRGWNQEFNNNYRPEGKVDTPRESPARTTPAAPTGNAWAKGPPTSVTSMHNSQHNTPTPASPPRGAAETNTPDPVPSSTNDQPPDTSSTADSPQTEGSPTVAPTSAPASTSGARATSHETTPDSTTTASATMEKEEGTKKFTFNVNAPAFKPRSITAQMQQSQQLVPPPGGPPQAMMGAVPMVPAGVPIQTAMPPPAMLPTMQTGQPPVLVQWQGAPGQQYQMPGYQYVVAGGQPVSMMASQPMAMGGPRPGGPPTVTFQQGSRRQVMVPPSAQWQPHVMQVGQGMVPYTYQSFSVQGGGSGGGGAGVVPPPQSGFTGPQAPPPQMMSSTPQATAPPPGIYPQRFVPAQGYVLPQAGVQGQARFPTPQQTPHQGMDAAHFQAQGASGSAAASTGPNSQPPTPGPSPAQGGRGGSPVQQAATAMQQSVGPPPPQQFMAPVSAAPPPHFYATAQPVYGMYSTPTGQGMVVYSGPGGVPMAMPPAHHDPTMMQQPHQQQQQGSGGLPPPHHQQYTIPHEGYGNFVQATPFYQQPPPNQMARQNSAPQTIYQQQGPGAPPPPSQQQQQAQTNTPSTAPPQQQ